MPRRSPWPVNYIPQLQAKGMSATEALGWLRERGLGIRTQTFYRAWGETVAALDKRENVEQARLDRRPLAQEITPLRTKSATGFRYQVSAAVVRGNTGEVYYTPTAAKFDKLVSYDTALQAALGALSDAQVEGESLSGDRLLGGIVTEVRELTPDDFADETALL